MALVNRPFKAGGTTNYVAEVALGNTTILAVEVDDDFDTLYNEFNGNIDNANIKPAAGIATSKLALDAGLQTGHYADGSVTLAKLAADSVDTTKIVNGTILAEDLAPGVLDGSAFVGGFTVAHHDSVAVTAGNFTTEITVATLPAFTPAGASSVIRVGATITGGVSFSAASSLAQVTVRLKRNGSTVRTLGTANMTWPATATFTGVLMAWSVAIDFVDTGQTASTTYTLTVEALTAGTVVVSRTDGDLSVVEHR